MKMDDMYPCGYCGKWHYYNSQRGKKHIKYEIQTFRPYKFFRDEQIVFKRKRTIERKKVEEMEDHVRKLKDTDQKGMVILH